MADDRRERFENYMSHMNKDTDPDDFLAENRKVLEYLKTDEETSEEYNYYKALSNELRFYIFKLLQKKPMCTCALAQIFDKKDNVINHHLQILEIQGLVRKEKEGYYTIYY
ncbi:MAG: helix-turn-helix domain-containing protein, partial [Candidatus Lokiarchaeota archaeon]|nr:helix-turn-helix domain-containing protein [Candidatus Lokiarchaeota archaeon]